MLAISNFAIYLYITHCKEVATLTFVYLAGLNMTNFDICCRLITFESKITLYI